MLTYAETACRSTNVPVVSASQSQCQQDTTHPLSSVSSYRIGPIDPAQLIAARPPVRWGGVLAPGSRPSAILCPHASNIQGGLRMGLYLRCP